MAAKVKVSVVSNGMSFRTKFHENCHLVEKLLEGWGRKHEDRDMTITQVSLFLVK